MEGKGKRGKGSISEDSRLNTALRELAEMLAEIAAKGNNPASFGAKHRPDDSTINKKCAAKEN